MIYGLVHSIEFPLFLGQFIQELQIPSTNSTLRRREVRDRSNARERQALRAERFETERREFISAIERQNEALQFLINQERELTEKDLENAENVTRQLEEQLRILKEQNAERNDENPNGSEKGGGGRGNALRYSAYLTILGIIIVTILAL